MERLSRLGRGKFSHLRSLQRHFGVVHSSDLCTEITLNTSADEVAVCNLGSVNLLNHVGAAGIDHAKLKQTATVAPQMLDNVIDISFCTIPEARRSQASTTQRYIRGTAGKSRHVAELRQQYRSRKQDVNGN